MLSNYKVEHCWKTKLCNSEDLKGRSSWALPTPVDISAVSLEPSSWSYDIKKINLYLHKKKIHILNLIVEIHLTSRAPLIATLNVIYYIPDEPRSTTVPQWTYIRGRTNKLHARSSPSSSIFNDKRVTTSNKK